MNDRLTEVDGIALRQGGRRENTDEEARRHQEGALHHEHHEYSSPSGTDRGRVHCVGTNHNRSVLCQPVPAPDILIVNFNSGLHLRACLESVRAHAPGSRAIVVDNASSDGSEAAAERAGEHLTLVRNEANVGFGAAVNRALRLARSETVLLMNPDCLLREDTLGPLEAELAAHPECAVVGPRVVNDDGSLQGSVRGDPTLLTGLFGRTSLLTRWFPRSAIARRNVQTLAGRSERSFTADWISGACLLARRDRLASINGFDERFFLYWEDADLCLRLRQAGWTIRYVSNATVVHTGGVSSGSARAVSIRAFHRSAYVYYATHLAHDPVTRAIGRLLLSARCRWKLLKTQSPSGEA